VLHAFDQLNCKFVAVRSSGTKEDGNEDSFAGQFDTYLFVTKEKLIEQILECHASVKSDRILAYCASKGINPDDIKVAVVVQKMVNSESAGVCFTANPITGNSDEVMIEA
jgi:pyruvate,water dikinase